MSKLCRDVVADNSGYYIQKVLQKYMRSNPKSAPHRIDFPYNLDKDLSPSVLIHKPITRDGFKQVRCTLLVSEMQAIFSNFGYIVDRILARVSSAMNAEKVDADMENFFRFDLDHTHRILNATDEKWIFIAAIAAVLEVESRKDKTDCWYHVFFWTRSAGHILQDNE
uniref:AlNc14C334G10725 protein n=1 Tax=Albugo laibachii Nc14 TaxID=890382 RepID=F0WWW4_9STRA|nr:AlNc14C334G10725 [Albugo laibachii Nc14]|eukprot:CCA25949.1 AlNc14C334G10725 [Albugo laibachii Nc14]